MNMELNLSSLEIYSPLRKNLLIADHESGQRELGELALAKLTVVVDEKLLSLSASEKMRTNSQEKMTMALAASWSRTEGVAS